MGNFLKAFFGCLLALIVFSTISFFFFAGFIGGMASKQAAAMVSDKSMLVIDLAEKFQEQSKVAEFSLSTGLKADSPNLYELLKLIETAAVDSKIEGIYLKCEQNNNGFAASSEIRAALERFRKEGKFIYAYGNVIPQRAYHIANVASKIYASPQGMLEWNGMQVSLMFFKSALDNLQIVPQIFYAGKFKSATEPFRMEQMSAESKLQTATWLGEMYSSLLMQTAAARKLDTATLHRWADEGQIQTAADAVKYKLLDGAKYEDEVSAEISSKLKLNVDEKINLVSISDYKAAHPAFEMGDEKIALVLAEGNIVDGKGDDGSIGSESYVALIRQLRLDKSVKAIVLRINSGGGSAMASENIWRELMLAKKAKPLIVSMGDVAASGGYYIAAAGDSILATSNTITGSIGVFGIIPNMQAFFKNKLGVTFDGVSTGPLADMGNIGQPLSPNEEKLIQANINSTYAMFKKRVSDGRKMDTAKVEEIAQGRVWTGAKALQIVLVDRLGGLEDALEIATKLADANDPIVVQYPKPRNFLEKLLSPDASDNGVTTQLEKALGAETFSIIRQMADVQSMLNSAQARMPFQYSIK